MSIFEIYKKYDTFDLSDRCVMEDSKKLLDKWGDYIPKGWYGFSIEGIPRSWYKIIDEFLEYIKDSSDSKFEIHQIKLKFGGIRFYVKCDSKFDKEIEFLEKMLYDKKLIW
jgi:hypothetical protein